MKGQAAQNDAGTSPQRRSVCEEDPPPILWNGVPFAPSVPPFRESKIVRLRRPTGYTTSIVTAASVSESLVITREYRLTLISPSTTLLIITNAPEAADEFPESITTRYRDIGTFCDAVLTWRGREDRAFVSASLTDAQISSKTDGAQPLDNTEVALASYASAARGTLRTGILVGGPNFTRGLTPDEIELANLLMTYRDERTRAVYSYDEIGKLYGVNGETIRRRHALIAKQRSDLGRIIKAFRARNSKCAGLNYPGTATNRDEIGGDEE